MLLRPPPSPRLYFLHHWLDWLGPERPWRPWVQHKGHGGTITRYFSQFPPRGALNRRRSIRLPLLASCRPRGSSPIAQTALLSPLPCLTLSSSACVCLSTALAYHGGGILPIDPHGAAVRAAAWRGRAGAARAPSSGSCCSSYSLSILPTAVYWVSGAGFKVGCCSCGRGSRRIKPRHDVCTSWLVIQATIRRP